MPTAFAIASVEPPSRPRTANSTRAASRISSRRSVAVFRAVTAMPGLLATSHYLVKSLLQERHPAREAHRRASLLAGEAGKCLGGVHVVGEQHAALPQVGPGLAEFEPHAVERMLAVVHERADRAEPVEQRRQLVLRAPENQCPALLQLGRDQPARL